MARLRFLKGETQTKTWPEILSRMGRARYMVMREAGSPGSLTACRVAGSARFVGTADKLAGSATPGAQGSLGNVVLWLGPGGGREFRNLVAYPD